MRSWVLASFLLSLLIGPALGATYYVAPDGSGDFPTIQLALYASNDGDVVQLGDGIFTGPGNRDLDTNETMVTLESQSGDPSLCVIDCQGSEADPHFGIEYSVLDAGTILRGITIVNGYGPQHGGALRLLEGSITVENCIFADNSALNFGGAVYAVEGSLPSFLNCEFRNNSAIYYGQGGAVFAQQESSATFEGCTFSGNQADRGGALYAEDSGPVVFTFCIFTENSAGHGGVVSATGNSEVRLYNSTLFRNAAGIGSGVYLQQGALCRLNNSIIAYGRGGSACSDNSGGPYIIGCTDIFGNEGGDWVGSLSGQEAINNNANVDPQFCDPMGSPANFGLMPASPAGDSHPCGRLGAKATDSTWPAPVYVLFADGSGMHPTIQAAVDAVPYEAVIALEDGTYTGAGNRDIELRGKSLSVGGRNGDPATVILDVEGSFDDEHRAFRIHEGEPATATLRYLTMRNGVSNANQDPPEDYFGGAIRVTNGSSLRVLSCNFEYNTVHQWLPFDIPPYGRGGAIYHSSTGTLLIDGCLFSNNLGSSSLGFDSGSLQVLNSTFSDHRSEIAAFSFENVEISGCVFENYSTSGIHILDALGSVQIRLSEFRSERRYYGGAFFNNCESILVDQCLFEELDTGDSVGMPMLGINDSQATIQQSTFSGYGIEGRGAVKCFNSNTQFFDCGFTANTGQWYDGAVEIDGGIADFFSCTFSDNSFKGGGGVNASGAEVSFDQCGFTGNQAEELGGGAQFGSCTVSINGTDFSNNSATEGGGFYAESCNLTVDNCTFDANSDGLRHHGSSLGGVTITGTTFTNHTAGWAAEIDSMLTRPVVIDHCAFRTGSQGLRLFGVPDFRVANTEFSDNVVHRTLTISNATGVVDTCTFDRNANQSEGGALYMLGSDVNLQDCSFADNSSLVDGGAVHILSGSVSFARCNFDRNHSANNGGALASFMSTADLADCSFNENVAETSGGAMYVFEANTTLTSCSITNGVAAIHGGGVSQFDGTASYSGGRIEGNQAQYGGGISISVATVDLTDIEIVGNTAEQCGGLSAYSSNLTVTDCRITDNNSALFGGLFLYYDSTGSVTGTIIADNTSSSWGSGVTLYHGANFVFQQSTITGNGGTGSHAQILCDLNGSLALNSCIVAFGTDGPAVLATDPESFAQANGSNVYGNAGGDWTEALDGLLGVACNFSLDPLFCNAGEGDFHLAESSPCAAENNACGLDVGAFAIGCTGVSATPETELPTHFSLLGNSPNPFNPRTDISFELPAPGPVILEIFDVTGRRVRRLISGDRYAAGSHQVAWDGNDDSGKAQSSGIYLYRVHATGQSLKGKMAMIR